MHAAGLRSALRLDAARPLCRALAKTVRCMVHVARAQGVNIMAFCKEYNAATSKMIGDIIPVEITVYEVGAANNASARILCAERAPVCGWLHTLHDCGGAAGPCAHACIGLHFNFAMPCMGQGGGGRAPCTSPLGRPNILTWVAQRCRGHPEQSTTNGGVGRDQKWRLYGLSSSCITACIMHASCMHHA